MATVADKKINPSNIHYLSFEGGGGKGAVYLGAVKALEEAFYNINVNNTSKNGIKGAHPLFRIHSLSPAKRPLKGISGSSAGAITALMLALGCTSKNVEDILDKTETTTINGGNETVFVSSFENFFQYPDEYGNRNSDITQSKRSISYENEVDLEERMKTWGNRIHTFSSIYKPFAAAMALAKVYSGSDFLLKRLFLSDRFNDNIGAPPPPGSGPYTPPVFLASVNKIVEFIYSALLNRGIFSGMRPVEYFSELIKKRLVTDIQAFSIHTNKFKDSITEKFEKETGDKITFSDFFNITGVDLVVTGSNISNNLPRIFSVKTTPDFSVAYAVAASMNIPLLFKPLWINTSVDKSKPDNDPVNIQYKGLYVDGGLINNLPVKAFGYQEKAHLHYGNELASYSVAAPKTINLTLQRATTTAIPPFVTTIPITYISLKEDSTTLGFSLLDFNAEILTKTRTQQDPFKGNRPFVFGELMGAVLNASMYNASFGQLDDSLSAVNQILFLNTQGISTLDFCTAKILESRLKNTYDAELRKEIQTKINDIKSRQNEAYAVTQNAFTTKANYLAPGR
ncbi:MAG TPA: patatin-like phospholipase family protein [Chitinophagales bacterium]|nr:patatin-like phospholipase family protein [Chitinophagales bacterium]